MRFNKWVAPLLAVSLSVVAAHALADVNKVGADGESTETIVLRVIHPGTPALPALPPLKVKASRHHSEPERLTLFTVVEPTAVYKSLIVLHSDPFTIKAPTRRYRDTLTLTAHSAELTLDGVVDESTHTSYGTWKGSNGSSGIFFTH